MNRTRYQAIASRFSDLKLLVVGDLILDRFIWGKVRRISPEAPVPVVEVDRETSYPGGAANVARNLREFAGEIHLLGQIGACPEAAHLRELLLRDGIGLDLLVEDPGYQTIVKTRIIAQHQQVVRVDRERKTGPNAVQVNGTIEKLRALIGSIDGIIIEDYGKGFLSQELIDAIVAEAGRAGKIVTVDPNPANAFQWTGVTTVKPNRNEAYASAGRAYHPPVDPPTRDTVLREVGATLLERWGTQNVLVTLGEHGIMLFDREKEPFHIPTRAQEVYDVSGAGDTTIALFTLALCAGATPVEAAEIANQASGIVVGKLGTATVAPGELSATFPDA
ncbi:MAG TPA: PfkB family carbohydrate kinase [Chthoniobacteraceae bacterium]|nr:PfkB family carbohydrate kinase [Chthoniobacteraceae bacterium]